eukprot:CAMPEP_0117496494 /NCGR_PEP_ID=MMETSP0784-20121206/20686_1 /TAXON_ID=39447 /ORGANISM="" /LENGTH=197 /DNA_ID=CAMNT_0005291467 /DNA_START=95 /DNA_END=689 /DNA_ORIENTATION=+
MASVRFHFQGTDLKQQHAQPPPPWAGGALAMSEAGTEKRPSRTEQKAAAEAFSDRLNCTPAIGSEADRFREVDDRFKAMSADSVKAIVECSAEDLESAPEVAAAFASWCILAGETPATVARCAELAADPEDFRLVGVSSFRCLSPEELSELEQRIRELDPAEARGRQFAAAEIAATLIEWMQAGLALHHWAQRQQKQ